MLKVKPLSESESTVYCIDQPCTKLHQEPPFSGTETQNQTTSSKTIRTNSEACLTVDPGADFLGAVHIEPYKSYYLVAVCFPNT